MTRLGWVDQAEKAFLVAVSQRPRFALAHRWLMRLYREYLRNPVLARQHADVYRRLRARAGADSKGTPT